jgi:3-hydroxy acid dehydrogenase/malonic semialdehyde reductase
LLMIGPFRTALVTGASSGIGRAIAAEMVAAGLKVLAVGRNREALAALHAECGAIPFVLDVRDKAGWAAILADHQVDVLVNNAGVLTSRALFQEIDPADIDTMVEINLTAPLHISRLALPPMIARGFGHLFFIGSSAGRGPHPNAAVYGASKAGISLFCDALRCDLLGTGVRVSEIAPGRVETKLYRTAVGLDAMQAELYEPYESIRADDIATLLMTALRMPVHVDVSRFEVFPTAQAFGGSRIVKKPG